MTAKADLFAAVRSLADQGRGTFSPAEVLAEARRNGSTYPDVTLRTMMIYHLRADEGRTGAGNGFIEVGHGRYRFGAADRTEPPVGASDVRVGSHMASPASPSATDRGATVVGDEWVSEANIQAAIVRVLAGNGCDILRVASTAAREQGVDIEARDGLTRILVEVKGFPSMRGQRGSKQGVTRSAGAAASQARTYFGNALLSGFLMRSDHPQARVALAFPAVKTYGALAHRTIGSLHAARVEVWLVDEAGSVTSVLPAEGMPA